jgi:hypothetical protein
MKFSFRDAEHLLRLAAIFLIGALLFVVVRAQMVPDDFGKLGHYRPSAIDDARKVAPVYAGQAACAECHTDGSRRGRPRATHRCRAKAVTARSANMRAGKSRSPPAPTDASSASAVMPRAPEGRASIRRLS